MKTELGAWIFGIAALLLVVGVVTQEVRILALIIPLAVYLALGMVFGSPRPNVRVRRRVDRENAFEGDKIHVSVTVENRGPSIELLEIYDPFPAELALADGTNYSVSSLQRHEVREIEYDVAMRVKGRHLLGPVRLRSRDLSTFFIHETVEGEAQPVLVSPGVERLDRATIPVNRTRPWWGQIPARAPGIGTEFWSIRDYTSGDEMRRINWKASARFDELLSNEYEGERSGDFILVLDAREEAAAGTAYVNAIEMGVRAAVSLADHLLEGRNRVGLITMRSVLDWVYPAFGRRQLDRIVQSLVEVRPGGQWRLKHLPWVLGRFFPSGSHLIIISPEIDASTRSAIIEMKSRGFDALVLSPSALDLEMKHAKENPRVETAYEILKLERSAELGLLRSYADVADWKPGEPLALALREVGRRRRVRA
ncbi:MAG: DUF58 domain-containing protein [Thermoplasmata archaeon]|nr:DUF58 domain-containing protein [Thermoplasmata archaeon]